jgi:hypothetical protein
VARSLATSHNQLMRIVAWNIRAGVGRNLGIVTPHAQTRRDLPQPAQLASWKRIVTSTFSMAVTPRAPDHSAASVTEPGLPQRVFETGGGLIRHAR